MVKKEQQVERHGVRMTNFVMEKRESLKLRRLTEADKKERGACGRILMESFAHAWNTKEEAKKTIQEILKNGILIVALRNEEVAGFVGAHPEYPCGWELHPLAVEKEARGLGLGSLLTARIEREAAQAGAQVMYLGTDDEDGLTSLSEGDLFENTMDKIKGIQNRGGHPFSFYQKCGYQIVGVLPDVNGPGKPDIFMAKRLVVPSGNGPEPQKTGKTDGNP